MPLFYIMHKRIALLLGIWMLSVAATFAQINLSPYSHYGLGDLYNASSARSYSMGGIGIGMYDATNINRLNPASYADLRLTTFNLNGMAAFSQQSSNINSQKLGTAAFNNVTMAFSDRKGFGLVFGLSPYTSLGYDVVVRDSIMGDTSYLPYTQSYTAGGGLNQLYVGFGFRFLRHFYGGANLAYAFGTNTYSWTTDYDESSINPGFSDKRVSVKGLQPQFGLQYGDTIRVKREIERSKEIDQQLQQLDQEIKALDGEAKAIEQEAKKADRFESGKQGRIQELTQEKDDLDKQIEILMSNERENAKEIGKLQDRAYHLDKQKKDIQRKIKAMRKESVDAAAKLAQRRDRLMKKREALVQEQKDIAEGKKTGNSTKVSSVVVRLGTTFDPGLSLNGTRLLNYSNGVVQDTLYNDEGKIAMPSKLGFGFTFSKPNHWLIGADFSTQDWSKFNFFNETNTLQSAMNLNVGGEWIPEISSNKYGKKIAYRLGGYYNKTFLQLDGQDIKEMGVSFGIGLPIGYYNPIGQSYSRINLGFSLGKRGTLESNLLQEMNVQLRLGVNLNDIWFIKRRID
jgi:hypothetical protein